ncbi:MAG: translation initiation factor [Bacteroidetes bacterium]|nr:MAG: translation initiation factor [Bacteroidota bacterium]
MSKKNKKQKTGVVYSTNQNFDYDYDETNEPETLEPSEQSLKITLDKKQRRGKLVTLVSGFIGKNEDLKNLAKILKTKCGVGGSVKAGEIIIQGDFREKITQILTSEGFGKVRNS